MFGLYGGFFGGRRKASKPKKRRKENWFERLTVDQNKQLCKAAKLRHGGKKQDLIDRLIDEPQTSMYACEVQYVGLNVEKIKTMCRERNLQVSGTKFDLVLRIMHSDNESTPAGTTLKRAATDVVKTVDATTGSVVEKHVPKKRKKAAISAIRVYTRVQKKIEAVSQKKYQSHWGSKTHSSEVYGLVGDILYCDIVRSDEGYLTNNPRFALSIAEAACTSLADNFETMCRKGYDDEGGWSNIDSSLRTIVDAAKPVLSDEEREGTAEWIEALYNVAEPYGLSDDTDLMRTVEFIRGSDDEQKSDEDGTEAGAVDDSKPDADVASAATMKAGDETLKNNSHVVKENLVNSGMM